LLPAVDFLFESSCPSVWGKFGVYRISRTDITSHGELLTIIENAGTSFIFIDSRGKEDEDPKLSAVIDESINYLKYSNQISIKGIIIYTNEKLTWDISSFQNIRPVLIINKELDIYSILDMEIKVDAVFHENYKTQNVAGYIEGTSGSDSTIVITAHYDHLGNFGKYTYFAGANDNASGVAMMLNLAQHYSESRPEYTTIFISFSAEELELKGSRFFTSNPLTDLSKIKFLINFDLAGTGSEGIRVVNGSVFTDKFNLLTELNQQNNLLPKVDIRGPACNSDHCPFYERGVPCFYIYTQGGIQAYHEIIDMNQTLPLTEFFDYCTLMILFLDSL
jgi:aminopeptidase YwaD